MACSLHLKTGELKGDPEHKIEIPPPPRRAVRMRRDARVLKRGSLASSPRDRFLAPANSASRAYSESTSGALFTASLSPVKQMMFPIPAQAAEMLLSPRGRLAAAAAAAAVLCAATFLHVL
jgi:hypothetical protein